MSSKKIILELNNIDLLGRRFNGYDLLSFFSTHKNQKFKLEMLVNNRKPYSSKSKNLFTSPYIEEYDWIAQATERKLLGTKNQLSLAEDSLIRNPLYQKADVLHFHLYHNMNLPIEFLARIDPSKKIIIDIHDTYWLTDSHLPMLEVFNYTERNAASLTAQRKRVLSSIDAEYIVHSPYILNLFKKSDTTKHLCKVTLINFGIDTDVFHPYQAKHRNEIRTKLGIPHDNIVLFCRAQSSFKGVDYIKKALQSIDATAPITLLTCASLGMFDELSEHIQVIDRGVIYDDQEMASLFNTCDIFLSPSTEESFGFMAAEAMACGKPIIVFDGTALPDTTHAPSIGISVKRSATALRSAIEQLIADPAEREERGRAGVKFVATHYSLSDYYASYTKLFERLITIPKRKISQANPKSNPAEVKKFRDLLPTLQQEFDHPTTTKPPKNYPLIDYNDPGVQQLIQEFNTSNYHHLIQHPLTKRLKYTTKRIVPDSVRTAAKRAVATTAKHTPTTIKKFVNIIIRRK